MGQQRVAATRSLRVNVALPLCRHDLVVLHGESYKDLALPRKAPEHNRTKNIYNQPKRPRAGTTHRWCGVACMVLVVLHGEGRISPATPRNQSNDQPSRGGDTCGVVWLSCMVMGGYVVWQVRGTSEARARGLSAPLRCLKAAHGSVFSLHGDFQRCHSRQCGDHVTRCI